MGSKNSKETAYQSSTLPTDLAAFLMEEMPCSSDDLVAEGYLNCSADYPRNPGHLYFEGCFQGMETDDVITISPRTGDEGKRPLAPPRLRAFLRAFRRLNERWLGPISDKLCVERRKALADVAIQHHWGAAVPTENALWHVDATNSAVHLSLTLGKGQRTFLTEEGQFPQPQGNVYLSCPAFFAHAVAYPQCEWEDRVVAVQCRFLMTKDDVTQSCQRCTHQEVIHAVRECIASASLRVPTRKDVLAEMETEQS